MEIQTTKIELLKLILSIENPAILQKIKTLLLDESKNFDTPLTAVVEVDKQVQSPVFWLEQLSKIDSFNEIDNPVEWQRNIRKERKLPLRN